MRFHEGDFVRIVTPKEYRERGGSCTKESAIACYGGSICIVERPTIPGYKLTPYNDVGNFDPKSVDPYVMPIEHYQWSDNSLEPYEVKSEEEHDIGFENVF